MRSFRRSIFALLSAAALALTMPAGPAFSAVADPVPIPGGIDVGGGFIIHTFAPGPVDLGLMGENVEPNTITNFRGFSALAYILGTATDADGNSYTMVNDIRVFDGTYVADDGSVNRGTFAFI